MPRGERKVFPRGIPKVLIMSPKIAQDILERDRGSCIVCESQDRVQIAHIKSRGSRPDLRNSLTNLCCLCYSCHMVRQHQQGTITATMLEEKMEELYGCSYART